MIPAPAGDGRPDRPLRTIFFGSGAFAVPILDALVGDPATQIVAVVTAPDRPVGRRGTLSPVPVALRATEHGLPLLQPARLRDPAAIEALRSLAPALGVLADYGRLVPPAVLAIPPKGFLNVHPSLLPRHRGASPIPATILADDPRAGVTLMAMDAGLDTGPIVAEAAWPLSGAETAPELEARAAAEGAALLLVSLPDWLTGRLVPRPQDEAAATLTRPLRREDGRLDGASPARELERRIRAYDPWPGTFVETDLGRIAVLRAEAAPTEPGERPGTLVEDGAGIALATVEDRLRLLMVQPAGGRPMSAEAWLRGHPGAVGITVMSRDGAAAER
ncbi:MAG: methionyl-tRNA formyltransferase [Chloroflexota bacterium]|nr:methionyl-tRNA formyltransferase [Chloroflexota bacterium]